MKRGKKLLILVLCLTVVGLAAWGVSTLTKDTGTPMTNGDLIFSLADTKLLSWTCGEDRISFDISADSWINLSDEGYRINSYSQKSILDEITEIYTHKTIEAPGELSAYGLAQPRCTITADNITISLGDEIAMGGQLYLSIGDGKVYLVNSTIFSPFSRSLEEMAELEAVPDLSTATAVTATTGSEVIKLVNGSEGWYLEGENGSIPANQDIATGLFAHLKALDWLSCADCTEPDLADYGLDIPAAVYEITYDGGCYTLLLGSSTEQGLYAMPQGGSMVYLIDATAGNAMVSINTEDLTQ